MSPGQVESGRAFEWGIANALHNSLSGSIFIDNGAKQRAFKAFSNCTDLEKIKISNASKEIARFLINRDKNLQLKNRYTIVLQTDKSGESGDVRDVVISSEKKEIGISAKNRHTAVKHSRLSDTIDFGKQWFEVPCSQDYFNRIKPVFLELRNLRDKKTFWRDLENKSTRFYIPILDAFIHETARICELSIDSPKRMVEYLIGKYDFYKIIKENGDVLIQSFNLRGSLGWGKKVKLPSRMIEIRFKPESANTLFLTFDEGWQLSLRIHNAESHIVPSLKFDIQIIGYPNASQNEIRYEYPERS